MPMRRTVVKCLAWIGAIVGLAFLSALAFGIVVLFVPSHPVLPAGWTLQQQCNSGGCSPIGATPDTRKWLRFRIGMTHREALGALCDAILTSQLGDVYGVAQVRNGRCIVDPKELNAKWTIWGLTAPGFWCSPSFAKQTIYFDFDDKDLHLTRIAAYCPVLDL